MKVKMILPALTEATSPFFRPIKYSLFPPLGLATLAGYLDESDCWKKFGPLWDVIIRTRQAGSMLPVLEAILSEFGRRSSRKSTDDRSVAAPSPAILPAGAASVAGAVTPPS